MADERISEYTDDGSTHPIQSEDLLDFSNDTDGGTTYDVSKKILVSELATFFRNLFGLSITADTVPTGTGTGLKDSSLKISDFGDSNDHWETVTNFDDTTNYIRYVNNTAVTGGDVWHNAKNAMHFTVDDGHRLVRLTEFVVELATGNGAQTVEIGNNVTPTGAKVLIVGETDDNTKAALQVQDINLIDLVTILNDGMLSLKNGTGIDEFSTDGTLSGDSDDAVPTEKAVKNYVDGLVAPQIIGGVTLSSSSNTNILNGTYVILADTTTVTSVTSGIGQDSNWTLEITQAGITNQKGVVTFTGNLEKDGGGGANYDVAIFKNGSIVSESEQIDHKLESDGKGQSVTVMAIIEFSTNDTFDIRVSGNGTANDIFCGGGSLYLK